MTNRYVYDAELTPLLGSTFQPTGFPDIGPATFTRFENGVSVPSLLVESVQSMANRLEATAWSPPEDQPTPEVQGLPWVRVVRAGTDEFLTSSRLEAHRLASPFVHTSTLDGTLMRTVIAQRMRLSKGSPLNPRHIARAVAGLDPFCLIHGVFFSHRDWRGQPKIPRVISAVIEARDVQAAVSGGRKSDRVRHQLDKDSGVGGTADGYGSVPFHRTEWTAKRILASFAVDIGQIRSYGLPTEASQLLEVLAQWEIRRFLAGSLRLRTACDLDVVSEPSPRPGTPELPTDDQLSSQLAELIAQSGNVFGDGGPITVEWTGKKA